MSNGSVNIEMCVECKQKEAEIFCENCDVVFCTECNSVVHALRMFSHHKSFPISEIRNPRFCIKHKNQEAEFYDVESKQFLCLKCSHDSKGTMLSVRQPENLIARRMQYVIPETIRQIDEDAVYASKFQSELSRSIEKAKKYLHKAQNIEQNIRKLLHMRNSLIAEMSRRQESSEFPFEVLLKTDSAIQEWVDKRTELQGYSESESIEYEALELVNPCKDFFGEPKKSYNFLQDVHKTKFEISNLSFHGSGSKQQVSFDIIDQACFYGDMREILPSVHIEMNGKGKDASTSAEYDRIHCCVDGLAPDFRASVSIAGEVLQNAPILTSRTQLKLSPEGRIPCYKNQQQYLFSNCSTQDTTYFCPPNGSDTTLSNLRIPRSYVVGFEFAGSNLGICQLITIKLFDRGKCVHTQQFSTNSMLDVHHFIFSTVVIADKVNAVLLEKNGSYQTISWFKMIGAIV